MKKRKPARKAARTATRRRKVARKPTRRRNVIRKPARTRKAAKVRPAHQSARKPAVRPPRAPTRATAAAPAKRPSLLARLIAPRKAGFKPPFKAYRGGQPYLFASYSHRNMRDVFAVLTRIANRRWRVWYDEGIEPGNEWPEEVGRALTGCRLFLVFMSPEAIESRHVRNEITMATSENKAIMVVFLRPTELSEGMKLQLGTVQFLNRHEMPEGEFLAKLEQVLPPELRG